MGIGQSSFSAYRYRLADFLPNMYVHEFLMQSKKPVEIVALDAIVYPFDSSIWIWTFLCMLAEFFLLRTMHNIWSKDVGSSSNNPNHIFEGY